MWLPPKIGQPITSYATLIFVFMILTGLVLWWPKNKAAAKQRFWFRWKNTTQWKRKIMIFTTSWVFIAQFYCLSFQLQAFSLVFSGLRILYTRVLAAKKNYFLQSRFRKKPKVLVLRDLLRIWFGKK
ncbi:MAG: PepSY domain-containing protein [Cytophagaceae bacterium]|nr:PepSY domain-containing protein [Cytophagaceae bacterium]